MAILTALAEPMTPEHVVARALQDVTGFGDAIATECLRNALPEDRLPRLLLHSDARLSERMAWAVWHRDPEGQVPAELRDAWRQVVVEQMEDDHTLKAIFESDNSIAFDSLVRRVGNSNTRIHAWDEDEPFATAIRLMGREQRGELLNLLTRETWPRGIVSLLVNKEPELYRLLLSRPDLEFHHLEPLRGEPDAEWIPLARHALEAGYTAEEVASATRGMMWSWDGRESEMWNRWLDLFRPLTSDPDPAVRSIGDAGLQDAEGHLQRAQKSERWEAVYGR